MSYFAGQRQICRMHIFVFWKRRWFGFLLLLLFVIRHGSTVKSYVIIPKCIDGSLNVLTTPIDRVENKNLKLFKNDKYANVMRAIEWGESYFRRYWTKASVSELTCGYICTWTRLLNSVDVGIPMSIHLAQLSFDHVLGTRIQGLSHRQLFCRVSKTTCIYCLVCDVTNWASTLAEVLPSRHWV